MLMPDHVPQIDGRDPPGVAFAYCYGYIQPLIDALIRIAEASTGFAQFPAVR
jgi:D-mannonate dehydratase